MGLFSSSKSSSSNYTTTTNTDSKQALTDNAVAVHSFSGENLTIETADNELMLAMLQTQEKLFSGVTESIGGTLEQNSKVLENQTQLFDKIAANEQPADQQKAMLLVGVAAIAMAGVVLWRNK